MLIGVLTFTPVRAARSQNAAPNDPKQIYATALRRACALPALNLAWRGVSDNAKPVDLCRATDEERSAWEQFIESRSHKSTMSPLFFNDGVITQTGWWASAGEAGVWRGTAQRWARHDKAKVAWVTSHPLEPDTLYVMRDQLEKSLDKSGDGGKSFETMSLPEAGAWSKLAFHPTDAVQMWTADRKLWRSRDGGAHWQAVSEEMAGSADNHIMALAVTSAGVLAATSEGWIAHYTLENDKATLTEAALPRRGAISSLTVDPLNERIVYATYSELSGAHVWQSLDGGMKWRALDGEDGNALPEAPVRALALDPNVSGRILVGTDVGLFGTDVWSETAWSRALPGVWVTSLQIAANDKNQPQLYAFANDRYGAHVWTTTLEAAPTTKAEPTIKAQTNPCQAYFSPRLAAFPIAGGSQVIKVEARADCEWKATLETGTQSWISIAGPSSGKGSGQLTVNVAANTAMPATRYATIAINGTDVVPNSVFTIGQQGTVNNCKVTPIKSGEAVMGQLNSDDCLRQFDYLSFHYADLYSFSARAGELINVRAETLTPQTHVTHQLIGPDGNPVPFLPAQPYSPLRLLPDAGVYQLLVIGSTAQALPTNYRAVIQLAPPGCDRFTLTALNPHFSSTGGPGSLMVSTASNCTWQAYSSAEWVSFSNGANSGSQTLNFTLAENPTTSARNALIEIGGKYAQIRQAGRGGECGVQRLTIGEGINATLNEADCGATFISSDASDVYVFEGRAGQGIAVEAAIVSASTTLSYLPLYLYGPRGETLFSQASVIPSSPLTPFVLPETGTYTLAVGNLSRVTVNYTLLVRQIPTDCRYLVTPEQVIAPFGGGTVTFNLQTQSYCPWDLLSAAYSAEWLKLTPIKNGFGSRAVRITVPANPYGQRRHAPLVLAGQRIEIVQPGINNTCATVAATPGLTMQGALSPGDCPAQLIPQTNNEFIFSNTSAADRFSFTGTAGQVFSFTALRRDYNSTESAGPLAPIGYGLLDPQGKLLAAGTTDPTLPLPSLVLPATGTYLFELSHASSQQEIPYTLTLNLGAVECAAYASLSTSRIEASGGGGTINIEAPPTCPWRLQIISNTFLRLDDPDQGSGRAQVRFSFPP
ncbi:MAG: hypothetical protein HOP19_27885, partial [Acidobacteria bacterium]|nr:hypothetical protein [Acidobacteriota bacterium]